MPLKINAEKEGVALAKQYKVEGFPTILFLDAKGAIVGKIGGYMPPEGFSTEMSKVIKTHKELPLIQAKLKASPGDGEANAKMAAVAAAAGRIDQAVGCLKKAEAAKYTGAALSPAYNAVGDHFQTAQELDKAIGYFLKGDKSAKSVADHAYAMVSLMVCYLGKQDTAKAKAVAKKLASLKGAPAEYVKMAQDVLKGG